MVLRICIVFIDERHLVSVWITQYEYLDLEYNLPAQVDIDDVLMNAEKLVAS